jgi:putative ABC transport system substrate-binding protein
VDRRRFLLTSLAGAIAAPLVAGAQQTEKVHRVGYLTPFELHGRYLDAFKQGLRDLGYFEGSNLVIYARSAGQRYEDLRRLAGDLVTLNVDLIVAATGVTALAAKDVTSTVPIVMAGSADAQSQGIVKSLSKPGGNVTGLTMLTSELAPKRLAARGESR